MVSSHFAQGRHRHQTPDCLCPLRGALPSLRVFLICLSTSHFSKTEKLRRSCMIPQCCDSRNWKLPKRVFGVQIRLICFLIHEVQSRCWSGQPSCTGLAGAGGSTSNMAESRGGWQEASVPRHRNLFLGLLGSIHNMATALPRVSDLRRQ